MTASSLVLDRFRRLQPRWWEGQIFAIAIFLAGLAIRVLLERGTAGVVPFVTTFPAILISAVVGGVAPGITATVLGLLSAAFIRAPGRGSFPTDPETVIANLAIYAAACAVLVSVAHYLRGALARLRVSEERFRAAQEVSVDGFLIGGAVRRRDGGIADFEWLYANPTATALLTGGLDGPPERLFSQTLGAQPGNRAETAALFDLLADVAAKGGSRVMELPYQAPGAGRRWYRAMAARLGDGAALSLTDITVDKLVEVERQTALQHKETLLREMNHRIKNSLQVVSGLLQLEAIRTGDPELRAKFEEAANRVRTVGDVHRQLYAGSRIDAVEMQPYLQTLASDLGRTAGGSERPRRVAVKVDRIVLPTDNAVAVALITNELVTNAFKYAHREDDHELDVRVCFQRTTEGGLRLAVTDDGIGLDRDFRPEQSTGLGMRIVASLARQVEGTFRFEHGAPGARFIVEMPAPPVGSA